jgi:hypothetical protein
MPRSGVRFRRAGALQSASALNPIARNVMRTRGIIMDFGKTTPILRIFDEAKAREFYVDFLGFKIDWQHRFEESLPLYLQISKDCCAIPMVLPWWWRGPTKRSAA